ncbi:MAG: hypothetical protein LUB63_03950 [Oscillospiraceae bacterium]|nr:hypothetical protein [Oscillospiraceae bacterium]
MAKVTKRPVAPIYAVAALWLVWGLFFPLHTVLQFVLAAVASVVVYCLGRLIWPVQTYEVPDPVEEKPKEEPKKQSTGNKEIDALIAERDRAVGEMHRLNDSIKDPPSPPRSTTWRPPPKKSSPRWWSTRKSCPRSAGL